jgi:protein gp37
MADGSHIEWTDATWNPITGCSLVSPGCTNCYAMGLAGTRLAHHWSRIGLTRASKAGPVWTGEVRLNEEWLDQPLRWRKPRRIFVCAHGDLFHESVPNPWIDRVFAVMALTPQHTYQVLTKRAARMRAYVSDPVTPRRIYDIVCDFWLEEAANVILIARPEHARHAPPGRQVLLGRWPLPNVWKGVSAEDQDRADERVPELLATPAAVRFVSAEPLLGPIDFRDITVPQKVGTWQVNALECDCPPDEDTQLAGATLDQIIVGGENGPRPMHPDWVRAIRDQCAPAGTAFFLKQWGTHLPVVTEDIGDGLVCHEAGAASPAFQSTRKYPIVTAHGHEFWQVGKKLAGRLLDGVEHSAMPGASR